MNYILISPWCTWIIRRDGRGSGGYSVVILTTRGQVFSVTFAGARTSTHHYRPVAVDSFASATASTHSKDFLSKHPRSSVHVLEIARNRFANGAVCAPGVCDSCDCCSHGGIVDIEPYLGGMLRIRSRVYIYICC